MASVRQADTALWLHNKLSSDDPWSGSSLRSLLTQDVLKNIPECFHRLEPQVKIKLLMAFLHLPRRVLEDTSSELGEILEIGSSDEDEWVRVLCEILKYYPTTGMLNVHLEHACPAFAEVTEEMRKTLAVTDNSSSLMPLECPYLNKVALLSVVGQPPTLPKHFTLRRKPKSAALRAELIQKANEVLTAQKKGSPSGLGNTSHKLQSPAKKFEPPLRVTNRSVPRPSHGKVSGSGSTASRSIISAATLKHHGRTKLLDINEQPIGGGREVKRRKKVADGDQGEEAKQKKAAESAKSQEPATPDYAAGLHPLTSETKATSTPGTSSRTATTSTPTPSYAVLTSRGITTLPTPPATQTSPEPNALSESTLNLKRELETAVEKQRQLMLREIQQKQAAAAATAMASLSTSTSTPPTTVTPSASTPSPTIQGGSLPSGSQASSASAASALPAQLPQQTQQQLLQQQQNKRQLTLSREQMLAAHEMFRNANRVSRAEKALILGFMAGARDKPFPHQGPIITIKLSENTETVQAADGSQQNLLVEMLFEMNYDTGHWRRLKRTRVVSKQTASGQSQPST